MSISTTTEVERPIGALPERTDVVHGHIWSPIEDLPANWSVALTNQQTVGLVKVWHEQKSELRNRDLYKNFLAKLQREWAIETGVIEGIYKLSDAATFTLIEQGLDASYISHDDTDLAPEDTYVRIQDQHAAILGLYDFVSGARPLGTSYVKELHRVLTAHQHTYVGVDTLGNIVTRPLPKGTWKTLENHVQFPDGTRFEYCPPEHVAQEMDHLVAMHMQHEDMGVTPDVEAAWLHHRFALIHPFTDGNGRVARCLATLVFLKANWLPLVITRQHRPSYIDALRSADNGDLKGLVDFFGTLQSRAIRKALSLTEDVLHEATAIKSILKSVEARFSRQRRRTAELGQQAISTADSLQLLARHRLDEIAAEVTGSIQDAGEGYRAFAFDGTRNSDRARFNYYQIVQCAKKLGYFADFRRYQAWACLVIQAVQRTELLLSFHGIGREFAGVLGCSAMIYAKSEGDDGERSIGEIAVLSDDPFQFTYVEDPVDVQQRFRKWLDECVLRGLDIWQKSL